MTYAAGHRLFLAAAVASMHGGLVRHTLALSGDGRGLFDSDSRGPVTVTVTRVPTAGPPAAEAADALAGHTPAAGLPGGLPARTRATLSRLADFFNTSVTPPG